ncbi:DUF6475 domain-containing protein [Acidithiobacillus thiooxidans]|uniref:DUF6475 domain-containing protein n=1 Tax=Acidithiobacillus thiooxidans ATCC 19377 TaxID=637390 RepID=A0A543Q1X4_ACITH|nr:DUF6475 domain-containing protein [Acidithiobacillus thiooxidans]MDX5935535.1 DUF6475 domain-containing protein [Acidithiobacillus thiooxidans]TQN50323.1 hypothetical protein DLNHIDIE_00176 [Acidithiobacillus thiooxidans ATCC 19377]
MESSEEIEQEESFAQFTQILIALGEYYHRDMSSMVMNLYWQALRGYPLSEIKRVIGVHVAHTESGVYFPKVADFIRLLDGGHKDNAALAWTKLEEALKHVGTYQDIVFDDPYLHAVIRDMGGWIHFGEITLDKWPFVGNDFRARYTAYRSRGLTGLYPASLRGRSNGENWSASFPLDPPVLWGDRALCLRVIAHGEKAEQVLALLNAQSVPSVPQKKVDKIAWMDSNEKSQKEKEDEYVVS